MNCYTECGHLLRIHPDMLEKLGFFRRFNLDKSDYDDICNRNERGIYYEENPREEKDEEWSLELFDFFKGCFGIRPINIISFDPYHDIQPPNMDDSWRWVLEFSEESKYNVEPCEQWKKMVNATGQIKLESWGELA
jgi:hypothetical protein